MILMGETNRVQVARKGMEININQQKETTKQKEELEIIWYKKIGMWKMPQINILEEILMQMEEPKPWHCSFFDHAWQGKPVDVSGVP